MVHIPKIMRMKKLTMVAPKKPMAKYSRRRVSIGNRPCKAFAQVAARGRKNVLIRFRVRFSFYAEPNSLCLFLTWIINLSIAVRKIFQNCVLGGCYRLSAAWPPGKSRVCFAHVFTDLRQRKPPFAIPFTALNISPFHHGIEARALDAEHSGGGWRING